QPPRFALARKDGEGDVVERAELVEQVHQLEGPRDSGADALLHRLLRHVVPTQENLAFVRGQQSADQIDEGRLAGAVGPDECKDPPLLPAEVHAIHRAEFTELLHDRLGLEQHGHYVALRRDIRRSIVPTMPVGSDRTSTTRITPRKSCQYTV